MIPSKYSKYKPQYLASGKRGDIYTFTKNKIKYIIKVKKETSQAENRISNEAKFLKILNKHNIGPKLIESYKDYLVRRYATGKLIKEYLATSKNPNKILKQILEQCFTMDQLGINKLEMHKPVKHIYIYKNKATMIDFERCYYTKKPKNVTQFSEFINRLSREFPKVKKIESKLLKQYKKQPTKENFKKVFSS